MNSDKNTPANDSRLESLENPSTVVDSSTDSLATPLATSGAPGAPNDPAPKRPPQNPLQRLLAGLNVYMLLFALVLVLLCAIAVVAYLHNRHSSNPSIGAASLSSSTLKQLANSDATVGNSGQVLNVQSSAVFAGKVLVRDSLEVAGGIQVGGPMSLTGITVTGTSVFDSVQVNKDLAVLGDSSLQGSLAVQKSLQVSGSGTFGGSVSATQITASSLQLNGDLILNHHLTAGGPTPSRSNGSALGSGGTASVSGSDTSGSVSINTGGGPTAGCFATINFVTKFNATPHVLVTPVGSDAAGLAYYVNRSTSNFSICTASTPAAGASFAFDYLVLD